MYYFLLLFVHVVGAAVLLGTGAGIAFFMLVAHLRGDPAVIAGVAAIVVLADMVFTATAVVVQPISGFLLAQLLGYPLFDGWIALSLILYAVTGAFWLPVVWFQIRMRELARAAVSNSNPLPQQYYTLFRTWFAFGIPAFASVLGILWLMITRPQFSFH